MADQTISAVIERGRRRESQRGAGIALRVEERRTTFAELDQRSERLAAALLAEADGRPGPIAILARNCVESVEVFFAAAKAGAVLVPVDPTLGPEQVYRVLRDAGASWLFADDSSWDLIGAGLDVELGLRTVLIGSSGHLTRSGFDHAYGALLDSQPAAADLPAADPDADFLVRLSCSDAEPTRREVASQRQLLAAVRDQSRDFGLLGDDAYVSTPGSFWLEDPEDLSLAVWFSGGRVMLSPACRFDPACHCATLADAEATVTTAAASHLRMIASSMALGRNDLSRLRLICAPGPASAGSALAEISRQLPSCEIRTTGSGSDSREFAGWLGPPPPSVGWASPGDRGCLDLSGFLSLAERGVTIVSAGLVVRLAEVQAILAAHPGVADVALVPIASAETGEGSRAYLTLRPDSEIAPEDLVSFARWRLPAYKVPREWTVLRQPEAGSLDKAGAAI